MMPNQQDSKDDVVYYLNNWKILWGVYRECKAELGCISIFIGMAILYGYMNTLGINGYFLDQISEVQFAVALIVTGACLLAMVFACFVAYPLLWAVILMEYEEAPTSVYFIGLVAISTFISSSAIYTAATSEEICVKWLVGGIALVFNVMVGLFTAEKIVDKAICSVFAIVVNSFTSVVVLFAMLVSAEFFGRDDMAVVLMLAAYSIAFSLIMYSPAKDSGSRRWKSNPLLRSFIFSASIAIVVLVTHAQNFTNSVMNKMGVRGDYHGALSNVDERVWYRIPKQFIDDGSVDLAGWGSNKKYLNGSWYVKAFSPFSTGKMAILCARFYENNELYRVVKDCQILKSGEYRVVSELSDMARD